MFEIITKRNTATITLNDNRGNAPSVCWIIGRSGKAIYHAIVSYAKMHNVDLGCVGYSIVYDDTGEKWATK